MTTSTARLEANRRNSLRSTGPKTEAGKAASRLNAFKHTLAGQGDVVAPGEDLRLVAERAKAFGHELRADGVLGQQLAQRAALLSIRMERLATREMIAVAGAERQGWAEFDTDREGATAELLAEARMPGGDPAPALAELAACPDGLAGLINAWRELGARLRSVEPGDAAEVAGRWLGRSESVDELIGRVEAEVGRLQARAGSMAGQSRAIEQARREAGLLARFDPSPEATLARRYEAAAERGMYRAIRAIADLNRQGGRPVAESTSEPSFDQLGLAPLPRDRADQFQPRPTPPQPELASFRPSTVEPLASFRVGGGPAPKTDPTELVLSKPLDPSSPDARQRRPDLRELDQKHAQARR